MTIERPCKIIDGVSSTWCGTHTFFDEAGKPMEQVCLPPPIDGVYSLWGGKHIFFNKETGESIYTPPPTEEEELAEVGLSFRSIFNEGDDEDDSSYDDEIDDLVIDEAEQAQEAQETRARVRMVTFADPEFLEQYRYIP